MTNRNIGSSRFRIFKPDPDTGLIKDGAPLDGLPLVLPKFTPLEGGAPLDDGEPPTKLGARFRSLVAAENNVTEDEVPTGLIRMVEALSADNNANLASLRSPRTLRNPAGTQVVVSLLVHTPLVGPYIGNGRQLAKVAREVRGDTTIVTDGTSHPSMHFPQIALDSAEQPLLLSTAQRRVDPLYKYTGADRDFFDSIGLDGVMVEPVVAPFLMTHGDRSAWVPQTEDGWRRLTVCHTLIGDIVSLNADLVYRHWDDDGIIRVTDWTADAVRRSQDALQFSNSDRANLLYPPGSHAKSIKGWLGRIAAVTPEARAFHRVRTAWVSFVVAAIPHKGRSSFDVCYTDAAQRHVPALAAKRWDLDAVYGMIAVGAMNGLAKDGHATEAFRQVMLGQTIVPWKPTTSTGQAALPLGQPTSLSRVVATTKTMALFTANGNEPALSCVGTALKDHGYRNYPDERAKIAATQAVVVGGVADFDSGSHVKQVTAALVSCFRHGMFWREAQAPGEGPNWSESLEESPKKLAERAEADLKAGLITQHKSSGSLGHGQRALAALAAVAHAINPELLTINQSLTRTGRGVGSGGKSGAKAAGTGDPPAFLTALVSDLDGIGRCVAIIEAAMQEPPIVPLDPITNEPMTETWLRKEYLRDDAPDGEDDVQLDPVDQWWRDVEGLIQSLERVASTANQMKERRLPVDGEPDDDDDEALGENLFERLGIQPEQSKAMEDNLGVVSAFATLGMAIFQLRGR